ncbi:nuclear transport factor 2 family protein [Streptomyces bathyalis]|uniref:Nuclear transport factor 2 family protein n=1 Tax=Streptomyces bathyalis TaxID=2710756 RepID=A0A7T1WQM0_9ACTN|nr:nuclear transport factor 2 family protein [Streptomyces bathyalis]QPP05454.1 nuclear transport factor 2 family protein [Streptomyces bathyalis]
MTGDTEDRVRAYAAKTPFNVGLWAGFWAKPDATRVMLLAEDVVGDWPGDPEPVRGREAYRDRIARLLELVPDLHLEVAEHAENDGCLFIHWVAHGTGESGPFVFDGIDRILLDEDGLVKETVIRYDPAVVAARVGGRSDGEGPDA